MVKGRRNSARKPSPNSEWYELRYGKNWQQINHWARDLCGNRCCYPSCTQAVTEVHHAVYRDDEGSIFDREVPGVHVFPLCDKHHSRRHPEGAHHWRNWRQGKEPPPALDAHQMPKYYLLLRQGWLEKTKL